MGNCMERCAPRKEEEVQKGGGGVEDGNGKECGIKVKILLTRGELEWLMLQLKENRERKLEDVLMEIRKERRARNGELAEEWKWKPSLESIMESPEIQSFDENS